MWKLISQEGLFNPSFKINSNLRAASSKFGCRKLYKVEIMDNPLISTVAAVALCTLGSFGSAFLISTGTVPGIIVGATLIASTGLTALIYLAAMSFMCMVAAGFGRGWR